jgi:hypothetical protein
MMILVERARYSVICLNVPKKFYPGGGNQLVSTCFSKNGQGGRGWGVTWLKVMCGTGKAISV